MRRAPVVTSPLSLLMLVLAATLMGHGCATSPTLATIAVEAHPSVPAPSVLNVFVATGAVGTVPGDSFQPNPGPTFALPVLLSLDLTGRTGLATFTVDARDDLGALIATASTVEPLTVGRTTHVEVILRLPLSATCGDGVVDPGESCDGTDLAGVSCDDLGFDGGALACEPDCSFDTSGCNPELCGNSVLDPGEVCDGTDLGGESCITLGLGSGILGCTPECIFEVTDCSGIDTCGDGAINPGEECDGDDLAGTTCADLGFMGGLLSCTAVCQFETSGCTP